MDQPKKHDNEVVVVLNNFSMARQGSPSDDVDDKLERSSFLNVGNVTAKNKKRKRTTLNDD